MVLMVLRERRFLRWEEDREQKNGSDSSQIRSASIDDLSKRDDLSCKRKGTGKTRCPHELSRA